MDKAKFLAEKLKANFREHEVMRFHSTIGAGGSADFYFEAKTVDELVKAIKAAVQIDIPYFILGNGSNVIFSDYGFPGLVIKNATANISFMKEKSQVIADSGVPLIKLILEATSNDLSGLEFLYGVPGTIGGAVYGDAGAYAQSISDYVKSATILIPPPTPADEPQIIQVENEWFEFGYRTSKLKKMTTQRKPIILTVRLQLAQNRQEEIMRRLNAYKKKRLQSQPQGATMGSIFKNPIPDELKDVTGGGSKNMPELPKERTAGFMLENAGAKRLKVGPVRVSAKHANFIINNGQAKAQEVRKLIEEMRAATQKKFNVNLEEEIEYIGQW